MPIYYALLLAIAATIVFCGVLFALFHLLIKLGDAIGGELFLIWGSLGSAVLMLTLVFVQMGTPVAN